MSNVGPSPTLPPDTEPISSHTSTQQWQSFEFRMRHRRAERCLLRAEMALDAGLDDDAREALDEAERLHSDNPKLAALRSLLAERAAATVAAYQVSEQAAGRNRILRFAAALVMFVAVGLGAYLVTRSSAPDVGTGQAAVPAPQPPAAEPSQPAAPTVFSPPAAEATQPSSPDQPVPQPLTPAPADAPPPAVVDAVTPQPDRTTPDRVPQQPATKPALPAFNPQFAEPRAVALPPSGTSGNPAAPRTTPVVNQPEPAPAPAIPTTPGAAPVGTLDRMGEKLPAANLPAPERRSEPPAVENPPPREVPGSMREVPTSTREVPMSTEVPTSTNEEPRVRAVLARYEAAYSGLNASAAQEVWPAVDERSLARAFDTLQSQQVSLGRCAVQVEGTTASASCSGRVTWTPKVGGGSQSAARQWRFELHSGNGAWQITRAEVR